MHTRYVGGLDRHIRKGHAHCRILRMSLNRASTTLSLAIWVIYVPTVSSHPYGRDWQPWWRKINVTCSLPNSENEHPWSVNNVKLRILGNSCSNWLSKSICQKMATFTGKTFCDMLLAASWEWASMERQLCVAFSSGGIYVPLGCSHLFVRYWQPPQGKTTVICSLPHDGNKGQRSVKNVLLRILGNLCPDWL